MRYNPLRAILNILMLSMLWVLIPILVFSRKLDKDEKLDMIKVFGIVSLSTIPVTLGLNLLAKPMFIRWFNAILARYTEDKSVDDDSHSDLMDVLIYGRCWAWKMDDYGDEKRRLKAKFYNLVKKVLKKNTEEDSYEE